MMKKLKEEVENLNSDDEFVKFLSDEDEERLLKNTLIEKGSIKEKKNIALNMLNQNMDIELISNVTGLTKEEIDELK